MKAFIKLSCFYFATAVLAYADGTMTITFDDLPLTNPYNGSGNANPIPAGYAGFQWANFYYTTPYSPNAAGYYNGMVSVSNVAFNAYGSPAQISSATPFDLDSAYVTGAWNDGLNVEVQGFVGSSLAYDNTYVVKSEAPTLINFDYQGITSLNFVSSGGKDPGWPYGGPGEEFVLDNVTVTVPEPCAFSLACFGAIALLFRFGRGKALSKSIRMCGSLEVATAEIEKNRLPQTRELVLRLISLLSIG
jgi:hypothetical protein